MGRSQSQPPFAVGSATLAAAVCGRFSHTPGPAVTGAAACSMAGLIVAVIHHYPSGVILSVIAISPLAALFSYGSARRAETLGILRRTRAELARVAVAEERLRIARDLHDLLGHSLSLITLKAELAGRVPAARPGRRARRRDPAARCGRYRQQDHRPRAAGPRTGG